MVTTVLVNTFDDGRADGRGLLPFIVMRTYFVVQAIDGDHEPKLLISTIGS